MADLGWHHLTPGDRARLLDDIRSGKATGGPYHAEIYPADRCNIDCFFCSTAAIRGTDEIPLDRLVTLFSELKAAGTRSIRLAGGGEPLFHRKIKEVLRTIIAAGLPIENVTTNAVLLGDDVADLLIQCCEEVTVSLNTADPASYASMMQTPARNFERVLANVENLLARRRKAKARGPQVTLQFLVWRENFRSIPQMYALARRLDVDAIIFNGLSLLREDQKMNDAEIAEMLRLYEEIVRIDEFRRIRNIGNFEHDISADINSMILRLSAERESKSRLSKAINFFARRDFSLAEKIRHHRRMRRVRSSAGQPQFEEYCSIGWYSMVVRSDGNVAPCCILQHRSLGNVAHASVTDVWFSDAYQKFRAELTNIMKRGRNWTPSPDDRTVEAGCGLQGTDLCPMKTFYFQSDPEFVTKLASAISSEP